MSKQFQANFFPKYQSEEAKKKASETIEEREKTILERNKWFTENVFELPYYLKANGVDINLKTLIQSITNSDNPFFKIEFDDDEETVGFVRVHEPPKKENEEKLVILEEVQIQKLGDEKNLDETFASPKITGKGNEKKKRIANQ